jgi:hypothetical protein
MASLILFFPRLEGVSTGLAMVEFGEVELGLG